MAKERYETVMDKDILASARALVSTWAHLGMRGCYEQTEMHLESEFPDVADWDDIAEPIDVAMDEEFPLGLPVFG